MYTIDVSRKKQRQPSEKLAEFMRRWRGDRVVREVAELTGISHSVWSKLENKTTTPSFETLLRLSDKIGIPIDDLAEMAEFKVRRSNSVDDRAHRAATIAEAIPKVGALLDLLPELSAKEADTLLSVAETLIQQRTEQEQHQTGER
jgi:transcriptional regulator with XRE-family HTH domain